MQSKRCRQVLCTDQHLTRVPQTIIRCPHNRETLNHNQVFMTYLLFNLCNCLRYSYEGMKITITLSPIDVCPLPLATNKVVHTVSWDNVFLAEYWFLAVPPQSIGRPIDILWFPDRWVCNIFCRLRKLDAPCRSCWGRDLLWMRRDGSQGLSSPASSLIHGTTLRCLHTISWAMLGGTECKLSITITCASVHPFLLDFFPSFTELSGIILYPDPCLSVWFGGIQAKTVTR